MFLFNFFSQLTANSPLKIGPEIAPSRKRKKASLPFATHWLSEANFAVSFLPQELAAFKPRCSPGDIGVPGTPNRGGHHSIRKIHLSSSPTGIPRNNRCIAVCSEPRQQAIEAQVWGTGVELCGLKISPGLMNPPKATRRSFSPKIVWGIFSAIVVGSTMFFFLDLYGEEFLTLKGWKTGGISELQSWAIGFDCVLTTLWYQGWWTYFPTFLRSYLEAQNPQNHRVVEEFQILAPQTMLCDSCTSTNFRSYGPPKFFNIAPENRPAQKERLAFQPPCFRGELLNFGGAPRKTNMSPRNRWLEDVFPTEIVRDMLVFGGVLQYIVPLMIWGAASHGPPCEQEGPTEDEVLRPILSLKLQLWSWPRSTNPRDPIAHLPRMVMEPKFPCFSFRWWYNPLLIIWCSVSQDP